MTYLDTSALVKRFVREKGSERVTRMILVDGPVATSKIAYAEVYAALARRSRERALTRRGYATALRNFRRDWKAYIRVDLHDDVLRRARSLVRRHPLRAYDAVHLATAPDLKAAVGAPVTLVAADGSLLEAAVREHLNVVDPEV